MWILWWHNQKNLNDRSLTPYDTIFTRNEVRKIKNFLISRLWWHRENESRHLVLEAINTKNRSPLPPSPPSDNGKRAFVAQVTQNNYLILIGTTVTFGIWRSWCCPAYEVDKERTTVSNFNDVEYFFTITKRAEINPPVHPSIFFAGMHIKLMGYKQS